MNRYFVCYLPYYKLHLFVGGPKEIQDFVVTILNKDVWTEVGWIEYWLYRIFE